MDDKYQKAEQAYFVLRGKMESGKITRDEFEAALKEQMITDDQGRYWTLGIDSGKWYRYDGSDWVRADPESSSNTPSQPSSRQTPPAAHKSSRLPIFMAIGCLALICITVSAGAAFMVLNPSTSRPTIAALAPTGSVILTTPTSGAIAPPTPDQGVVVVATSTSEPTATPLPPTDTPIPTAAFSPTPAVPPGFYITALRTNPTNPTRRQDFFFDVRFLNATGAPRTYRWLVYIYRSDPSQQRNSLGETPSFPFTFPVGTGELEIGTWRLTGAGGCEDFVARVAWLDDNKRATMFTKSDGQTFEQGFTVCP